MADSDWRDRAEAYLEMCEAGQIFPCPALSDEGGMCNDGWHCMSCDMHCITTDPETWLCHACCGEKPCDSPYHHLGVL